MPIKIKEWIEKNSKKLFWIAASGLFTAFLWTIGQSATTSAMKETARITGVYNKVDSLAWKMNFHEQKLNIICDTLGLKFIYKDGKLYVVEPQIIGPVRDTIFIQIPADSIAKK